jgi:hypothetical protein
VECRGVATRLGWPLVSAGKGGAGGCRGRIDDTTMIHAVIPAALLERTERAPAPQVTNQLPLGGLRAGTGTRPVAGACPPGS